MAQPLEADRPLKYASIDSNTLYSQVQAGTVQSGTPMALATASNPQSLAALVSKPGRGRGGRGGGMQSIGKLSASATRRTMPKPPPPVNLPSEKSEQTAASAGDSGSWTGPAQSSQTPPPSDITGATQSTSWRPSNASARPSSQGAGRGDRFSRDFPELGASGGPERPPGPPRSSIPEAGPQSRPSLPDEGPFLKPQSVGNWRDGGGGRAPPHLPPTGFRPESNREPFGPLNTLRDEGPDDSRMPYMGAPIGPEPPWMGPVGPRMLPPGPGIMGPGGPSFAPPWIRGPPMPFGPPPPMFRAPRPQVIIPPSYRNRMSRPLPPFPPGGPPPPFERPYSIERDRLEESDREREPFRRTYEKRPHERDSSRGSDRERSPPRNRELAFDRKRPEREFHDKENQSWKERGDTEREPRQRAAEEPGRTDAERARRELVLERKRLQAQEREKAIEERIKREGWAAVTSDEVDYNEQLSFGSDDEGEREACERPEASPRDSRTSGDHRTAAADERARGLAAPSRSEQSLKRPPSTRSDLEAPMSDARRFEPGEQPPSARLRADTEHQARMRSSEQPQMAASQDARRFGDERRHDMREQPPPSRPPQPPAAQGPGPQSAQPKPFASEPSSHLQPAQMHEMPNQSSFQNFANGSQWYRDDLSAFEPQGPMQGFPFAQMPGFPERPFGFQQQPPQSPQVFKPAFGDMTSNAKADNMNFFSMEPPFPSEPIFGQPAANRAPSSAEQEDQLSAHLKRAQQRKEEKYRQGMAAARDASPPPAPGPASDYHLQGSQFAQLQPAAPPSLRTRVVSGGGVPEAQDETGNAPTGPAFPQGWISMRSGGAPPAMPPFGEPPPHVRPVPLSASEEPFKVSAWGGEPGAHGRPNKAERVSGSRGPKAPPSPNKVVSLLSLDLKPPPSLWNLGHKYNESGDAEADGGRWQNEDDGTGAPEAYEGGPQAPRDEFPQEAVPGDASASNRGMWPSSSSAATARAPRGRGAARSRGGSRGADPYSSRNTGASLLDRTGTAGGRRAPRSTLTAGSSGVVGALGLEGGPAWQRRGGSRNGRQGSTRNVRVRNTRSTRAARGAAETTPATETSPQESPNKNEQSAPPDNQAAALDTEADEEGVEGEDLEHDGDRDEWETASESSNVARHARANRSADSSPAPTDARSSGSARNLNLARGTGTLTVTVPGAAAATANAARRIERNLNNIDLNDISRVVVVESLPDNVVSQETGETDEDDGFTTVTHKRGKAARAAAAAKSPPSAPAAPATSIPSLLTLQTAPVFTSAAGAGAQQSKRQAHAKSAPQQDRAATARAMSEQQDSAAFEDESHNKWNGDSGDDITIGVIDRDREQPPSDMFKPSSVDQYASNTVLSKNYSVDQFSGMGAQPTGSLFGESSALFPNLGSPSQPSGSSYSDTHKSNVFPDLNLDNEEFASHYLSSGLAANDSVMQFPYSSPQQSAAAPSSDMALNFGYLEEQQQQRDALRMPSPNKAEQQRGAGVAAAAAAGAPRTQSGYFDSRPEAAFKAAPANVDPTSGGKSAPFGAMGTASSQQAAASEQQRVKQRQPSGDPESSRQARQAAVTSPGSSLHGFDHHYQPASHEHSLDTLPGLWNPSFAAGPPNSDFLPTSPLFASDSVAPQRYGRDTDLSKPFAAMNMNEPAPRTAKQPTSPLETQRVSEGLKPQLPAGNAAPAAPSTSAPPRADLSALQEFLMSPQFRDVFSGNPNILEALLQMNLSPLQIVAQLTKFQAANDAAASKGVQPLIQPTESSNPSGGIRVDERIKDIQSNASVPSKQLPQWNENQPIGVSSAPLQPPALPSQQNVQLSMPSGATNAASVPVVRQMPPAESFSGGQPRDTSRETVLTSLPQPIHLGGSVLGPGGAGLFGTAGFLQQVPQGACKSDADQVGSALSLTPSVSLSMPPQPLGYGLSAFNLGSAGAPSWNPLFNPLNASLPHPSLAMSAFSARPTPPPAVVSMNRSFGGTPLAPLQQPATSPPLQSLPSNLNPQLSLLSQVNMNKPNPLQLGQQQRGSLSGLQEQRPQQTLSAQEMLWPGTDQYQLANLLMTNRYQSSLPLASTDTGNARWPSAGMTTWSTPAPFNWQASSYAPPQPAGLLQPFGAAAPPMSFAPPPGLLAGAAPTPGSNAQLAGSPFMPFGLPHELQLQAARPALSATAPYRPARFPPAGGLPTSS